MTSFQHFKSGIVMKGDQRVIEKIIITAVLTIFMAAAQYTVSFAKDDAVFFREEFNNLENWRPLYFPKIKVHSRYAAEKDHNGTYLRTESSASASGLVFNREFNVYEYPKAKWKWKVSNVYTNGNALRKSGDDYPLRIYFIFAYDPEASSFSKRIKYAIARKLYGEYPPDSSLNYIWANRKQHQRVITNSYANEAQMIILQSGKGNAGTWQEQEVDILNDYRKIFNREPPAAASIAIMNDSDNTGESSVSYVDYIEVFR
jgi:hypothetical protein